METPEFWRWVWLAATGVFALGEMATAGTFFLLPFALGALVASVLAFAGVDVGIEWVAFVGVSAAVFAGLRPLARRLDRESPTEGIGAKRLIGQPGLILEAVHPGELGLVRINREEWRAESLDGGHIPTGSSVKVLEVRGTHVVVHRVESPTPNLPPGSSKEH